MLIKHGVFICLNVTIYSVMKSVRQEEHSSIKGHRFAQQVLVVIQQSRAQAPRLQGRFKVHMVLIQSPLGPRQQAHKVRPELNG